MDALPVCYAGRTTRRRRTLQSLPYADSASGEPGTELSVGSSRDAADQQPACMTALGEDLLTLVLSQLGEVRDICRAAQACTALAQLVRQSPCLFEAPLLRDFHAAAVAAARQHMAEDTAVARGDARLLYLRCREQATRDARSRVMHAVVQHCKNLESLRIGKFVAEDKLQLTLSTLRQKRAALRAGVTRQRNAAELSALNRDVTAWSDLQRQCEEELCIMWGNIERIDAQAEAQRSQVAQLNRTILVLTAARQHAKLLAVRAAARKCGGPRDAACCR